MRQLKDTELAVLGIIGYALSNNLPLWQDIQKTLVEEGYIDQIDNYQARMLADEEQLEAKVDDLLYIAAIELIEGEL